MSPEELSPPLLAGLASREELQGIFDVIPVVILVAHDPQCRRITGNRFAYAMPGLPPEKDTR